MLIIIALLARLLPGPRTIDDAYITFRYARNILNGEGFVYNPGEYVQGTTTPLYTLLMAGLGSITGRDQFHFPQAALYLNTLADIGTCILLWRLGKKVGFEGAGIAAGILWAVAPFSVTFAIGGLETSIYILLLTGIISAYIRRQNTLAFFLSGLAILTRPDALILVIPLGIDRLFRASFRREQIKFIEMAAFVVPLLVWELFAYLYFGSVIPHSVQAKLGVYHLSPGESFIRLLQHYATPFFESNWGGKAAIAVGLILYPFLYAIGAINVRKKESRFLVWILYPWLYLITFSLANPLIFRWYLTPPLTAYIFFIIIGAEVLIKTIIDTISNKQKTKKVAVNESEILVDGFNKRWNYFYALIPFVVAFIPFFSSLGEWRMTLDHGPMGPAPEMAFIKLELLYKQAADKIGPELNSKSVLAAGDVGVLGYFTPARILDTVGLNSSISLKYYPIDKSAYVINYAIPSKLITEQKPDWFVFLEVYGRKTILQDPQFLKEYQLVDTLPTEIYGSNGMLIYKKIQDR